MTTKVIHTCEHCNHSGEDVHEYPLYNRNTGEDTTSFQCDSFEDCLDRQGYYLSEVKER